MPHQTFGDRSRTSQLAKAVANGILAASLVVILSQYRGLAEAPGRWTDIHQVVVLADSMKKVIGHCRIGGSYASVRALFKQANHVYTAKDRFSRPSLVRATWCGLDHTLVGTIQNGRLQRAIESVAFAGDDGNLQICRTWTLDSKNPVLPRATTIKLPAGSPPGQANEIW